MSNRVPRRRFRMTFPTHLTDQPVLYRLAQDFSLVMNIRQARVLPDGIGMATVELQGSDETLDEAIGFLQRQGITVAEQERELGWNPDACMDCGFCLPVCEPQALCRIRDSGRITLEPERCTLCGHCVELCAYGAVWMEP